MSYYLNALVVGGSGNLGSEICRILVNQNFHVAFTYNQGKEKADALTRELNSDGGNVYTTRLDLTDLNSIKSAVKTIKESSGAIDSLIIASGIATGQKWADRIPEFFKVTSGGYDTMMNVNVRGVFFTCQETARIMAEGTGGKIIIVGSIDGIKPVPTPVDYACCKGALWGMTQALAKELGQYGILVNMVAPGILEGGIAEMLSDNLMKEYLKHCALKRVGTFSEVAKVIAFLAGRKNTYFTGQAVILDGGL